VAAIRIRSATAEQHPVEIAAPRAPDVPVVSVSKSEKLNSSTAPRPPEPIPAEEAIMAEARRQRRIAMRSLERRLVNEWPGLFDPVAPKPLAIGIHRAIKRATGVSKTLARLVLDGWCRRPAYLAALVVDTPRYALSGD
jgi:hypothetical protein